jgi:hypothetical protein
MIIWFHASGPHSPTPISIPTLLRQTVERIPNHLALGRQGSNQRIYSVRIPGSECDGLKWANGD